MANTTQSYMMYEIKNSTQRALEGFKIVEGTYLEIQQQINPKEDS